MEITREGTEFKEERSRPEPGGHQDLWVSKDREGIRDEGAEVQEQVRGVRLEVPDSGGRLRKEKPGTDAFRRDGQWQGLGWEPDCIRPGVASVGVLKGCQGGRRRSEVWETMRCVDSRTRVRTTFEKKKKYTREA